MLYDTHAHLDFSDFAGDLDGIVARAADAGVTRIIAIATDLDSSGKAIALAERFPGVYAAVGVHPCYVEEAPDDIREPLARLAGHGKVVAIGETGLDYHHWPKDDPARIATLKAKQRCLFEQQLEVAAGAGLNCVIHQRDSFVDTLDVLRPWTPRVRGVFHCFSGTIPQLEQVLALGCFVSFTGILTFKNASNVREALAATPAGRYMFETDCPYLAPVPHRGKRCEPAYVRETAMVAAGVRQSSLEAVSRESNEAAHAFFPRLTGS